MYKVILMSIRPQHLVKILNGEKTIEIRKTMPKCELPIDVYLYCKNGNASIVDIWDEEYRGENPRYVLEIGKSPFPKRFDIINGKVVAKFTLNKTEEIVTLNWESQTATLSPFDLSLKSCISIKDLNNEFSNCKVWHINNLVIFNKPMELGEFSTFKRETISCGMDCPPYTDWVEYRVRKAPKSWQYAYVEDEV
ncbi:MAG TPA: hypothetical protein VJZ51_04205 [Bacilli bacterium]|nr:hypothetical protein [Bacilli bacterium]